MIATSPFGSKSELHVAPHVNIMVAIE